MSDTNNQENPAESSPVPQSAITTPSAEKFFWERLSLVDWLVIISFPLGLWGLYLTFAFNKEAKPVFKVLSDVVITQNRPGSKIKVFYDSIEVQNVRAGTIALWNAGMSF